MRACGKTRDKLKSMLATSIIMAGIIHSTAAVAAMSRWGMTYLPNVEVIDQDGRKLRFYDDLVHGRIVVISFIYTSCKAICPLTLARLREVQTRLGQAAGKTIHFLSISIDPIPDTPERLKAQAEAFGIGPGWTFITGRPENIDLIRHKLGERSGEQIAQHKNEVLMYNDATGEWARNSAFADLGVLVMDIQNMDPVQRSAQSLPALARSQQSAANADSVTQPHEQPGQALFVKACAACHTIGMGEKLGPDLAGVTSRRAVEWITRYVMYPDRLRAAHDRDALELRVRYPNIRMPALGISETDAEDLIAYITAISPPTAPAVQPR